MTLWFIDVYDETVDVLSVCTNFIRFIPWLLLSEYMDDADEADGDTGAPREAAGRFKVIVGIATGTLFRRASTPVVANRVVGLSGVFGFFSYIVDTF